MYVEQNPNAGLLKNVTIKTDDFQLEFFIFDTLQGTLNATSATSTDIRKIEYQYTNNCVKTYVSKTNIFNMTLTAGGKYYFITQIDKTVLYAYGTEESASEILSIAEELGYINKSIIQKSETGEEKTTDFENETEKENPVLREKGLGYLIIYTGFFAIEVLYAREIWYKIAALADKSMSDISKYRKEVRYNSKKLYAWLIKDTVNDRKIKVLLIVRPLCALPGAIGIISAIIGLRTNAVDSFMDTWSFVVMGYFILMAIVGSIQLGNSNKWL